MESNESKEPIKPLQQLSQIPSKLSSLKSSILNPTKSINTPKSQPPDPESLPPITNHQALKHLQKLCELLVAKFAGQHGMNVFSYIHENIKPINDYIINDSKIKSQEFLASVMLINHESITPSVRVATKLNVIIP
jgi:hypothetical protein